MKKLRLDMLNGEKNSLCHYCHELENGRFPSPRQFANRQFAHHFPSVELTRQDGGIDVPRMALMDIRFSNLCNFRCRICNPTASSSWHDDAKALGNHTAQKILTPTEDPEDLWRQIEPFASQLEEVWFTGGEPFMSDAHCRVLKMLADNQLYATRVRYSTNFSIMAHWSQDLLRLWDQFKDVEIRASLDAMGRRGEYLRKGMIWDQVLRNRKKLTEICPRAEFIVAPTVSLMNSLHLPDFHEEWLAQGLVQPGRWQPQMLVWPEEHSIQALPASIKNEVAKKYKRHIEKTLNPILKEDARPNGKILHRNSSSTHASPFPECSLKDGTPYKTAMNLAKNWGTPGSHRGPDASSEKVLYEATVTYMMARDRSSLLPKFKETTLKIDRLRGEDFSAVFPELAHLMDGRCSA